MSIYFYVCSSPIYASNHTDNDSKDHNPATTTNYDEQFSLCE